MKTPIFSGTWSTNAPAVGDALAPARGGGVVGLAHIQENLTESAICSTQRLETADYLGVHARSPREHSWGVLWSICETPV